MASSWSFRETIIECEGVAEAAVIGVPDPIKGLIPVAFVTLRQGYEAGPEMEQAIKDKVVENIGKIAIPGTIYFTPVMPKTPSGKIMRRLLKEIVVGGEIKGDITGLEDIGTVEQVKAIVAAKKARG